jgi:hypothetical protein
MKLVISVLNEVNKTYLYEIKTCSSHIGMRGEQAKELCADFHVFHVQEVNGKANLTR